MTDVSRRLRLQTGRPGECGRAVSLEAKSTGLTEAGVWMEEEDGESEVTAGHAAKGGVEKQSVRGVKSQEGPLTGALWSSLPSPGLRPGSGSADQSGGSPAPSGCPAPLPSPPRLPGPVLSWNPTHFFSPMTESISRGEERIERKTARCRRREAGVLPKGRVPAAPSARPPHLRCACSPVRKAAGTGLRANPVSSASTGRRAGLGPSARSSLLLAGPSRSVRAATRPLSDLVPQASWRSGTVLCHHSGR